MSNFETPAACTHEEAIEEERGIQAGWWITLVARIWKRYCFNLCDEVRVQELQVFSQHYFACCRHLGVIEGLLWADKIIALEIENRRKNRRRNK